MKVLIWVGCVLVYAIVVTLINSAGVILGAIPTMILFGGMMWAAKTLCKKYDESHPPIKK